MSSIQETYCIYSVVAALVRAVAKLAYAAAATNGPLRGVESSDVDAVLGEVLGQLDNLLVLGTHISIAAEKLHATSGVVHRMRNNVHEGRATPDTLEEVRELVASRILSLRGQLAAEEAGPDTERNDQVAEGSR